MKYVLIILSLILFASCQDIKQEVLWLNQQETVDYNTFKFRISSNKNQSIKGCYIYTALQPIELELRKIDDQIVANIPKGKQLFSGPARLIIQDQGEQLTIFTFVGIQKATTETKDFRSPKTLITDSSLTQQQLVYTVGTTRNLVFTENKIATERWKDLSPQKRTYQAQEEKVETSFYVEAGSANKIELIMDTLNSTPSTQFITNLLQDKYGNQIANGTRATFHLQKGKENILIEKTTRSGVVKLEVPEHITPPYSIYFEIGFDQSNKLMIQ